MLGRAIGFCSVVICAWSASSYAKSLSLTSQCSLLGTNDLASEAAIDRICGLNGVHEQVLWAQGYDDCTGAAGAAFWAKLVENTKSTQQFAQSVVSGTQPINPGWFGQTELTPEDQSIALAKFRYQASADPESLTVLTTYLGDGYRRINTSLRFGGRLSGCLSPLVDQEVAAFREMPAFDGLVWRGLKLSAADLQPYRILGNEFWWPAFSSSSTDKAVALKFAQSSTSGDNIPVVFEIRSTSCRDLLWLSDFREREVLCLPGTHVKVTGSRMENGITFVELSQIR